MKQTNEAEIGLLSSGVAGIAESNSGILKKIRTFFKRFCKKNRKILVNNLNINFNLMFDDNKINLKLSDDQVVVLGSGNNIAETFNSMLNQQDDSGHGKQQ